MLKYKLIKSKTQYNNYCAILEKLAVGKQNSKSEDEIELLTLLIENYDSKQNTFVELDPVELLISFMTDHNLKPTDLAAYLETSRGYVSDILHYKKGLSKEVIRKLALLFSVSQEAFNRPYELSVSSIKTEKKRIQSKKERFLRR